MKEHVRAGEYLFREGGTADHFYVVMHGRIALELMEPGTGALVLESAADGEVLDWPWWRPPYRWLPHQRGLSGVCVPARKM